MSLPLGESWPGLMPFFFAIFKGMEITDSGQFWPIFDCLHFELVQHSFIFVHTHSFRFPFTWASAESITPAGRGNQIFLRMQRGRSQNRRPPSWYKLIAPSYLYIRHTHSFRFPFTWASAESIMPAGGTRYFGDHKTDGPLLVKNDSFLKGVVISFILAWYLKKWYVKFSCQ